VRPPIGDCPCGLGIKDLWSYASPDKEDVNYYLATQDLDDIKQDTGGGQNRILREKNPTFFIIIAHFLYFKVLSHEIRMTQKWYGRIGRGLAKLP
jgi:hypothetical protein